jgi:hypothetical protein
VTVYVSAHRWMVKLSPGKWSLDHGLVDTTSELASTTMPFGRGPVRGAGQRSGASFGSADGLVPTPAPRLPNAHVPP